MYIGRRHVSHIIVPPHELQAMVWRTNRIYTQHVLHPFSGFENRQLVNGVVRLALDCCARSKRTLEIWKLCDEPSNLRSSSNSFNITHATAIRTTVNLLRTSRLRFSAFAVIFASRFTCVCERCRAQCSVPHKTNKKYMCASHLSVLLAFHLQLRQSKKVARSHHSVRRRRAWRHHSNLPQFPSAPHDRPQPPHCACHSRTPTRARAVAGHP